MNLEHVPVVQLAGTVVVDVLSVTPGACAGRPSAFLRPLAGQMCRLPHGIDLWGLQPFPPLMSCQWTPDQYCHCHCCQGRVGPEMEASCL